MARRSEIFTKDRIAALEANAPFIRLFKKDDWATYLEITALIYDLLDESDSRVEFERVRALVEEFFVGRSAQAGKANTFFRMAISDLGIVRDVHDGVGNRFLEPTRAGKNLLKLCDEYIQNRLKFTGSGADDLLGALNDLVLYSEHPTREEAIQHHRAKIREYEEDIRRIEQGGVRAAELIGGGYSSEELFTRAEEAAQYVLAAGEDIKLEIEDARRELISLYRDKNASAGQAIRYASDFYERLRGGPAYTSFMRARDLLSHIPGLGGHHREKDVSRLFFRIGERNLVDERHLKSSSLPEFMRRFRLLIHTIESKIQEQMNILRVQIHYVIAGDAKRIQEELREVTAIFANHAANLEEFFKASPLEISSGLRTKLGHILPHDLELKSDPESIAVEPNELTTAEFRSLQDQLRKAEEASIARALADIRNYISRHGELHLSTYQGGGGIIEYYVLSNIEYFAPDLRYELIGTADYHIRSKGAGVDFVIRSVENRRIFPAEEQNTPNES